jgi:hypothetical protein
LRSNSFLRSSTHTKPSTSTTHNDTQLTAKNCKHKIYETNILTASYIMPSIVLANYIVRFKILWTSLRSYVGCLHCTWNTTNCQHHGSLPCKDLVTNILPNCQLIPWVTQHRLTTKQFLHGARNTTDRSILPMISASITTEKLLERSVGIVYFDPLLSAKGASVLVFIRGLRGRQVDG